MSNSRQLSKLEEEEIKTAFSLFDLEKTGKVDVQAMRDTLEDSQSPRSVDMLQKLPKSGQLTFDGFRNLFTDKSKHPEGEMKRVFELFDTNKKGFIALADLRRVAGELGEHMSEEELKDMVDRADPQGTGRVSFDNFQTIMTTRMFPS
eukprot:CAMPEP_0194048720 /NCGR_PEP_ID=MMETSP0009_2-20130614/28262_1 /TAXON_ID=210454 /ORGANISM="Grammatophora oceanica, Strain CCMP 410" /LENGTH=147 /DNA_ID=CAMNT_0038694671 /DNA_START=104 /DNA_END=547 /DNA_ORIENTATION=+